MSSQRRANFLLVMGDADRPRRRTLAGGAEPGSPSVVGPFSPGRHQLADAVGSFSANTSRRENVAEAVSAIHLGEVEVSLDDGDTPAARETKQRGRGLSNRHDGTWLLFY